MKRMKVLAMFAALSLLVAGTALNPSLAGAAEWLPLEETYQDNWVRTIEQELNKDEYRWVFVNDPRMPQATVMWILDQAAAAYEAGNVATAEDLVRRAIGVLEQGAERNYYSHSDIEPILSSIREHRPVTS